MCGWSVATYTRACGVSRRSVIVTAAGVFWACSDAETASADTATNIGMRVITLAAGPPSTRRDRTKGRAEVATNGNSRFAGHLDDSDTVIDRNLSPERLRVLLNLRENPVRQLRRRC